ncbi:DUF2213 domain-containing protein [Martelella lutilitoris]|uniref:DUF2213 domain-containing protein n=1 Tax=Martelella lutilitoris TaxID=2583532 RepID=A0A7T7HP72_9HYPH|nr:DUF2213 domain-containing protein [Martelella lutilitoris]QQM32668.1 DUF2213 domain-containing protein [Martelella lutilitoris]
MQFIDAAPIAGTRRTADGYLVAEVRTARTGIQDYAGYEVGKPAMDRVRVYRPDDQVFAQDSMGSYAHKPVTNDHPAEMVTADNWKKLAVGAIGDEVARDGDYVRVPMIVMDKAVIDQIEGGKRELSAGYVCDLKWESGTTPQGEAYDAIQQNIRINHVAVVDRGRAGSQARIGDGAFSWGMRPGHVADEKEGQMADNLRKVMVDGLQVETTDAGAAAIEKLTNDKAVAVKALADAEAKHASAIAAKDAELAQKDATIDDLKGKVLDEKALDAKVQARADLIATAKTIAKDIKTDGLSDADIRKAAVVAKLGDEAVKDKGEAYIDARFDILAEDAAKADPFRDAMKGRDTTKQINDNGQSAYEARVAGAWKSKEA